jgi:hypothetical protein
MKPLRQAVGRRSAWDSGNGRYSAGAVIWRRLLIILGVLAWLLLVWLGGLSRYIGDPWTAPPGSLRHDAYQFLLVDNGRIFAIAAALYGLLVIIAFREQVAATFNRKARLRLAWFLLLGGLASGLAAMLAWHFSHL